jgi:hypothetical protein
MPRVTAQLLTDLSPAPLATSYLRKAIGKRDYSTLGEGASCTQVARRHMCCHLKLSDCKQSFKSRDYQVSNAEGISIE